MKTVFAILGLAVLFAVFGLLYRHRRCGSCEGSGPGCGSCPKDEESPESSRHE